MNNEKFNNEDYRHPRYWKWGLFYFNKNDKRIFPPKKIKYLSWTINFANPISIIATFGLLVLINLVLIFILKKR